MPELLVIAIALVGVGLAVARGRRAVPLTRTGEVRATPARPRRLSLKGAVKLPSAPLAAPCSLQPCLYYEVVIERRFEKVVTTRRGTSVLTGYETVERLTGGSIFELDDGSGPVAIELSSAASHLMQVGLQHELSGREWGRTIRVGHLAYALRPIGAHDGWTIGFRVTERYVPADGVLRVVGHLEPSAPRGLVRPSDRTVPAVTLARAV